MILASASPVMADDQTTNAPPARMEMADPYISPTNDLGSWIWTKKILDNQTCQLWNKFDLPDDARITKARLGMTTDNEFTLYLDGRELGRGAEWRELFVFDLTPLLTPGRHVLAVQ